MELNEYLIEKESVSSKISAFDSPDEYSEGGYPNEYFAWGLLSTLLAIGVLMFTPIGPISEDIGMMLGVLGGITGVGLWAWGFLLRSSSLKVHTANKTYSFYAKESGLDNIAHSVRGHEMKH